jgi:PHD-finger
MQSVRSDGDRVQSVRSDCGVCTEEVKEGEKGVQCDDCKVWFHTKCVSIDPKVYQAMTGFKSVNKSALYWFCGECNKGFQELKLEMKQIKAKQQAVEDEMKQMRLELNSWKKENGKEIVLKVVEEREKKLGVEELQKVVEKLKVESSVTKKEIQDSRVEVEKEWKEALQKKEDDIRKAFVQVVKEDDDVKKSFVEIMREQEEQWSIKVSRKEREESKRNEVNMRKDIRMGVVEEMEREKRKNNLVLMGVPEEGNDGEGTEKVAEVINGLIPEAKVDFVLVGRIGKKENGTRPIRIRVEDQSHRRKLLGRAKDLKSMEGLGRIYIVPDLTRVQQLEDKKLRDEVKRLRATGERGVKIEKGVVVVRNGVSVAVGESDVMVGGSGDASGQSGATGASV